MDLSQIIAQPKTGKEPLHSDGQNLGFCVLDFWRWSVSDLLSNATRGILAEFIVARTLDIPLGQIRDEWGAYDLLTPEGIKVEVKSAAYVQSWHQAKLSEIRFCVPKTRAWDANTNIWEAEARRQADVYVFAVLMHTDQTTLDPLNVCQWQFFVLPTAVLDSRTRSQDSITLRSLEGLSSGVVQYGNLKKAVEAASVQNQTSG